MAPPEWVDWNHLSNQHRYVQEDNNPRCMTCGVGPENHWYPKLNPKNIWDEATQIVDDYNRRLLG